MISNLHQLSSKLVFCLIVVVLKNLEGVEGARGLFDPQKTLVFGPGLTANLVFPARYFFIYAVDTEGNNFTTSLGKIAVNIWSSDDYCRIWLQVLDRKDGSYIVRYKLYKTCPDLYIEIKIQGEELAGSPYYLKGPVNFEECYCPDQNINDWLKEMDCPTTYSQIERDLSRFKRIDMKKAVTEAKQRFKHAGSYSLCHYAVVNNKVHRQCIGEHVGFKMFMDAMLLSLLRKVKIPDLELIVNLGDWPLEKLSSKEDLIPIFSWCGSEETADIVMPTYDLTESTLETMGRVMLDMMSVQSNCDPAWENKTEKAFWRGRDSRMERLDLVKLARKNPTLIDASLTNFFFYRELMEEYGPSEKHISFFDFFKFKYQINIDGTVAAYRFPYLLAGNSVVLKQDSQFYEHFYSDLQPMVHYIPFQRNLSDLVEKIQWAKDHDDEAKTISLNGQKFARENLMAKDIYCYYAVLLKDYSQLLEFPPEISDKMEEVPQPDDSSNSCHCPTVLQDKDEL